MFKKFFFTIDTLLSKLAQGVIFLYQYTLSPDKGLPSLWLKGRICAHEPHCSQYSILCLQRYGFFASMGKIGQRVFSCTGSMQKIYDPEHYKVVFFSSAPIGVPFLESLQSDKRFEVIGIVTMPDAPSGRGMKMQENVIKTKAKEILGEKNISKVILLHGTNASSSYGWYPSFVADMKANNIPIFVPDLPNAAHPLFSEWAQELDKLQPDENTILIGQSRGGSCILRWLETLPPGTKVKKIILVATPDGHTAGHEENNGGFYSDAGYNFAKIKKHCHDFVVFHSRDDDYVDFAIGEENARCLDATFYPFADKGHMGKSLTERGFPELTNDVLYGNIVSPIQTPNSLRLDSTTYATEAKEFQQWLTDKKPDFLVVIAYGKIIPQAILDIPRIAPINVHGSILPKYRGASPIQSVFLHDETETGITIMKMATGLDTGAMIDIQKFLIHFDRTAKDIITKMQQIGPDFLVDTLWKYGKGLLGEVPQDEHKATVCGKIEKEDGLVDPRHDSIASIYKKYRAYFLWPKVYFMWKGKRVVVEELVLDEKVFLEYKDKPLVSQQIPRPSGTPRVLPQIASQSSGCTPFIKGKLHPAVVKCSVKPEGSKVQSWDDFVKGYM